MHELTVRTGSREVLVDITDEVRGALARIAPRVTGVLHVFVPHTTAGVTVNEGADPSVVLDILDILRRIVPRDSAYRHGEGNSDAHVKTTLVGSSVAVPIAEGRLRLGTWQSIYLAEFDGPRTRRVWLEVTPAAAGA